MQVRIVAAFLLDPPGSFSRASVPTRSSEVVTRDHLRGAHARAGSLVAVVVITRTVSRLEAPDLSTACSRCAAIRPFRVSLILHLPLSPPRLTLARRDSSSRATAVHARVDLLAPIIPICLPNCNLVGVRPRFRANHRRVSPSVRSDNGDANLRSCRPAIETSRKNSRAHHVSRITYTWVSDLPSSLRPFPLSLYLRLFFSTFSIT